MYNPDWVKHCGGTMHFHYKITENIL